MRVLLLTPPQILVQKNKNVRTGKSAFPLLGIGYLSAALEDGGHEVSYLDFAAQQINDIETIIKKIKNWTPDVIGISFTTNGVNQVIEMVPKLREHLNVPIILGGAHPTYFPDDTLDRIPQANAIVVGEGEKIISDLVESLVLNNSLDNIPGICYRDKNGNIIKNKLLQNRSDLDEILPPSRHVYDNNLYHYNGLKRPAFPMITSRGCPYGKCSFCYNSSNKNLIYYRRHSVERVIMEIKSLIANYGVKEIIFHDDDFTANNLWVSDFCAAIHREQIEIRWICKARAISVSRQILHEMAIAGCKQILFGVESANQHLLDGINKGMTVEQNRRAIQWTHEEGIWVHACFMMLLPGEVPADAKRNVEFAKELDIEMVAFGPTRPLFGTPLFEQCKAISKKEIPIVGHNRHGDYYIPIATFIPEGYSKKEAIQVCRNAYIQYYIRPRYIFMMLKKIKSFEDIKRYFRAADLYIKLILHISKS